MITYSFILFSDDYCTTSCKSSFSLFSYRRTIQSHVIGKNNIQWTVILRCYKIFVNFLLYIKCEVNSMKYWNIEILKYWNIEILKYWNIEILKYWNIEILKYWNIEILKYWNIEILKYWNIEILKYWYIDILKYWNIEQTVSFPLVSAVAVSTWLWRLMFGISVGISHFLCTRCKEYEYFYICFLISSNDAIIHGSYIFIDCFVSICLTDTALFCAFFLPLHFFLWLRYCTIKNALLLWLSYIVNSDWLTHSPGFSVPRPVSRILFSLVEIWKICTSKKSSIVYFFYQIKKI